MAGITITGEVTIGVLPSQLVMADLNVAPHGRCEAPDADENTVSRIEDWDPKLTEASMWYVKRATIRGYMMIPD